MYTLQTTYGHVIAWVHDENTANLLAEAVTIRNIGMAVFVCPVKITNPDRTAFFFNMWRRQPHTNCDNMLRAYTHFYYEGQRIEPRVGDG